MVLFLLLAIYIIWWKMRCHDCHCHKRNEKASKEEDLGRITCGNAILSGSLPECEYKII